MSQVFFQFELFLDPSLLAELLKNIQPARMQPKRGAKKESHPDVPGEPASVNDIEAQFGELIDARLATLHTGSIVTVNPFNNKNNQS